MPDQTAARRMRRGGAAVVALVVLGVMGSHSPAQAAAGCAGAPADLNGDGYADAVVADPGATVAGRAGAGRVHVLYGDADGRVGEGARAVLTQDSSGIGDLAEAGDRFGFAVAVADLDGDGCSDLVAGTPYEDLNGLADNGLVQVLWGDPAGLGAGQPSQQVTQTSFGLPRHAGDQLGYAVDALENVTQGGTDAPYAYALAVGAPGWDVAGRNNAGGAGFFAAYDGENNEAWVTQDSPGIPGAAEAGDRFGAALSLNYLVGSSGIVDCAVGVPNEDVGSLADAGAITLVQDIYFPPAFGYGIDQNSAEVAGAAEAGDQFARALDTVRQGSTTWMAAGVPGEDVGSAANAGAVQLFSSDGEQVDPTDGLSQNTPGVSGVAEAGDLFGDRIALTGPGLRDGFTRVAVSAPEEDGAAVNTGLVQVFPIGNLDGETSYAQDTPGVPGAAEANDRFGRAVSVVTGASERVLLIGVPDDVGHPTGMVNVVPLSGGSPRFWAPGVGGVPLAGSARFGDALPGPAG